MNYINENNNNKEHIAYYDYLRIISMFGVVFMHAASGPLRMEITPAWHILNIGVCFFFIAVPIFFMISGSLLLNSKKTLSINYTFKNRITKLIIPLTAWSAIAVLPQWITPKSLAGGFKLQEYLSEFLKFPSGNVVVHLWFMYTLIPIYLISPFLKSMIDGFKKEHIKYLFVLCFSISIMQTIVSFTPDNLRPYVQIDFFKQLELFGGFLGYFIMGYYLNKTKKHFPTKLLVLIAVIDLSIISIGTYYRTITTGSFSQVLQITSNIFIMILSICIFLIFKQCLNKDKNIFIIKLLSSLSFGIYLFHNILISLLGSIGISSYGLKMTLVVIFITIIGCIFTIITLATIKPLCYIFTGIKYDKACKSCNWIYIFNSIFKKESK